MKVIKYLHSCLLVEDQEKTVLLDPGNYTYQEKVFPIDSLTQLDAIGITHEHQDHMDVGFIKELVAKFPQVQIFSNSSVQAILEKENVKVLTTGTDIISLQDLPHEKLLSDTPPVAPNVGIIVCNSLLHVGDSLQFTKTPKVLALPVQAPWGSMVDAARKAAVAKPQYIIPIHDYHWKDEVRKQLYQWLVPFFKSQGTTFFPIETGEPIEIS